MAEFQSMKNYNAIPILQVCPGKITNVLRKQQLNDSNNRNTLERSLFTPSAVDRGSNQGDKISKAYFELKIVKLKLTKVFLESLGTENNIFNISWKIMDFPESILKLNVLDGKTDLELSVLYKLEDFEKFSQYLETNIITFILNIEKNEDFVRLATADVFFSKALRLLRSKVYDQVDFYHFCEEEGNPILIGTLNIWYQLTFPKKSQVELGIPIEKSLSSLLTTTISVISTDPEYQKVSTCSSIIFGHYGDVEASESEVKKFQEDLFLVLNRNKALRTTQSEISRELKDRAEWLNEEAIWRRTLQEYAILSGMDPFDVQWRQWRDANTSKVVLRSFPKKETTYEPVLELTVVQIVFFPSTPPYQNEKVQQIYVEYSFLNMDGPEMESDATLPKPPPNEPAIFNFKKSFGIDLGKDRRNCLLVSAMIEDKICLRVSVVSEPSASYEVPIQTCEELGYAEVDFFNLVQLEVNESKMDRPIMDSTTKKIIGTMTIEISGILALRKMALLVLAPEDYNIIV